MPDNTLELILSLTIGQFQQAVKTAEATINSLGGNIGKAMSGADAGFRKAIDATQAYSAALSSMNGTADHFKNTMAQLAAVVGGSALFGGAARQAVSFNSTVEQSRIGVAALVRTFNNADMGQSFVIAEDIQKRLQIAGLQTTATYEQLLKALQEGIGPALRENFNPAQVVAFTQAMTQAGAALALPMDQLGQELRAILDGTIDRNARIANALRITNDDVKGWKAAGTLFDNLQKKLKAFSAAGEQAASTFAGAWSNVQDAVQMALGKASEDSFKNTTKFFLKLKDAIVTVDEAAGTFKFNEKIMAAFAGVDVAISKMVGSLTSEQISAMLVNLVGTFGAVAEAVVTFVAALMKVGEALGPLGPIIAAVVTWSTLLFASLKLLAGGPMLVYRQLVALNAGFAVLAGGGLLTYIKHVQLSTQHTALFRTALASLPNFLATASAVLLSFGVGWTIGTLLNKFDFVQKAGIAMAAGLTKAWLQAKIAWTSLNNGDTSGLKAELAEAERIYAGMFAKVGAGATETAGTQKAAYKSIAQWAKESAEEQKQAAEKVKAAQAVAVEGMKKKYQEYAAEVKRIQGEIVALELSADQQLRSLARTGMSEKDAWEDKKKQAQEYATVAKIAGEAGRSALQAGNTKLANSDFETAKKYAEMAKTAFLELGVQVKNGDKVYATQEENITMVTKKVQELVAEEIKNLKELQTAAAKSGDDLIKESGFANLTKGMDEFDAAWLKSWKNMREGAKEEIKTVEERLEAMVSKERTVWVNVKERQAQSSGGLVGYMRGGFIQALATGGSVMRNILSGGFLPGFGGGDTVPLLGERGEVMLNKYAVQAGGLKAALAFNSGNWAVVISELMKRTKTNINDMIGYRLGGIVGMMPPVQALADGGEVTGSAADGSGMIRHEHILKVGNTSAKVYTDDLNAGRLLAVFERARRMAS